MARLRILAAIAVAAGCVSCGDDGGAVLTAPVAVAPSPTPTPTPGPGPTPTPSPVPTATPPTVGNSDPTVSVSGGGSCYPSPSRPCSVDVEAVATDPDGDSLRYSWSGCASGSGPRATCEVTSPGTHTATVTVSDGRGGSATASKGCKGTNRAPTASFFPVTSNPQPANRTVTLIGNGSDPDEGFLCGRDLCVDGRASGACTFVRFDCTCLAGVEIDVHTTTGPGTCKVTLVVQDEWGLRGSGTASFPVSP